MSLSNELRSSQVVSVLKGTTGLSGREHAALLGVRSKARRLSGTQREGDAARRARRLRGTPPLPAASAVAVPGFWCDG
jgi:hypothetical protein